MESLEKEQSLILPEGYSYHPEGYLWHILPVEKFDGLPESVDVGGQPFDKKSEFHVTVVNARRLAREIADGDPQRVAELETELQQILGEYVDQTPILLDRFVDDLRLATSVDRVSIAARCTMNNIEGYFDLIRAKYGQAFPLQPTHVSIYTKTGAAVGIDSVEQMESYEKIELPEVQNVLNAIRVN